MARETLRFENALLPGGWARDVAVTFADNGMIGTVEQNAATGRAVAGIALPGLANTHSHAHQRAMAGLAEHAGTGPDSFWTWRETMYRFAHLITPEELEAVAAQACVEMLLAGFTAVGEFQYLHHQGDGTPYRQPGEMSERCLSAAGQAGIAITILPAFYHAGGFGGAPPGQAQRRFTHCVDGFVALVSSLHEATRNHSMRALGIAPHSLRAVSLDGLAAVIDGLDQISATAPIHLHIAEQAREVDDCIAHHGKRPVDLLFTHFDVSQRWCLIHATHMSANETDRMAKSGAIAGLCPITEANLGDGTFNAVPYLTAGGAIAIGSDSHVHISAAGELRQLEYSQRLKTGRRNVLAGGAGRSTGRTLFDAALAGGWRALAQPAGAITPGCRGDIVVLDSNHPALIGRYGDAALDSWVFAGETACVRHVFAGGRQVIENGAHPAGEEIKTRYRDAVDKLMARL